MRHHRVREIALSLLGRQRSLVERTRATLEPGKQLKPRPLHDQRYGMEPSLDERLSRIGDADQHSATLVLTRVKNCGAEDTAQRSRQFRLTLVFDSTQHTQGIFVRPRR